MHDNHGLLIAGVDEVGRGPLAGPVVTCAIILDNQAHTLGLTDSKALSEKKRQKLMMPILTHTLAIGIGHASPKEIDALNIHNATLLAMSRSIEALCIKPKKIYIDGRFCPPTKIACEAIIKGDQKIIQISAASIIAKLYRDQLMVDYDQQYPYYGFAKHKGYPTKKHRDALSKYGATEIHRQSFGPVATTSDRYISEQST